MMLSSTARNSASRLNPYSSPGHSKQNLPRPWHDRRRSPRRFGFFLEALEYGTPPHGGIALGLDRIVMIIAASPKACGKLIPFPKTARAVDLMVDAPTPVSEAQLRDLGIP